MKKLYIIAKYTVLIFMYTTVFTDLIYVSNESEAYTQI